MDRYLLLFKTTDNYRFAGTTRHEPLHILTLQSMETWVKTLNTQEPLPTLCGLTMRPSHTSTMKLHGDDVCATCLAAVPEGQRPSRIDVDERTR